MRAQLALGRAHRAFSEGAAVAPTERRLAGLVSGAVYLMGGVSFASFLVLPGITQAHRGSVLVIVGASCAYGLCLFLIDWQSAPSWVIHLSTAGGLGVIAVAVASSGGADSPAWVYLFFVAVYSAYFFPSVIGVAYLLACPATQALPMLYDSRSLHGVFVAQLLIATAAYLVLGAAIIAGRRMMWSLHSRAAALADEQSALRRVATAVMSGEPPERIYELVALEVGNLLQGDAAAIVRFDDPPNATVMGSWADASGGRYEPGRVIAIRPGSDFELARESGLPVRTDSHAPASPVERLGYAASIVAPVQVDGRPWGALALTSAIPAAFTAKDDERLMAFGDLLATALASIEDRAKLAAQASSDTLTGVFNHRTLRQRLEAEVARAVRHGRPLSVAVIDIDNFKQINDSGGHDAGDETLVAVATCLRNLARAEDTLGRVGGDEFAWVLPDSGRDQALLAVERARRAIAATVKRSSRLTVSAGICDTSLTNDAGELIRLADGALYWSKAHGRNQCSVYDPDVIDELSAEERAERLERQQAIIGLRALARAIDAKDPGASGHSERVSELVRKLALVAGWSDEMARLLSEAALVHDVGKIGVPDALLRKPGSLTAAEREQMQAHAELAAMIVEEVLGPEQAEWIRTHHERPDGTGYPRGLHEAAIPEGAALLALADAWDTMTVSRLYSLSKTHDEALAECVRLVGTQFTADAVRALIDLDAASELPIAGLAVVA